MPTLVKTCEDLSNGVHEVHKDFRLWLSSEPSPSFPSTILENGIKLTIEPARGIKANLLGSFSNLDPEFLEISKNSAEFKKLLFGLCFFHAVVRERSKYGALGWNNKYVFSHADLKISMDQLRVFVEDSTSGIPFEALHYLAAECNYGGRVTDDKDRRLLANILDDYYTNNIFDESYSLSRDRIYYVPQEGSLTSYISYIDSLPMNDPPEVFGLHENAQISFALKESSLLFSALLKLQPNAKCTESKGWSERVDQIASDIELRLPPPFDLERAESEFPVCYEESMNTVLTQELIRFNRLLHTIKNSLSSLRRGVKGLIEMSSELEEMAKSMIHSKLPHTWKAISYPSLKPLGSWVSDLLDRITFFTTWLNDRKAPNVFWISGFYFTQAFITATLQNYARKHNLPIDTIKFDFRVLKLAESKAVENVAPEDGVIISGLFLDGAKWDDRKQELVENNPRELFTSMPYIHLLPKLISNIQKIKGCPQLYSGSNDGTAHVYECPFYRTSERWGILTTTGKFVQIYYVF